MDRADPPAPWITTVYFCRLADAPERVLLRSSGGGFRGPPNDGVWWPQHLGSEEENLGSVLLVERFPIRCRLGIRVIAYGIGEAAVQLMLYAPDTPDVAALRTTVRTRFVPVPAGYGNLPGYASLKLTIPEVEVGKAGLYWLSAQIGAGVPTRLPLYVDRRSTMAWTPP